MEFRQERDQPYRFGQLSKRTGNAKRHSHQAQMCRTLIPLLADAR
jgi:hypothetical protein